MPRYSQSRGGSETRPYGPAPTRPTHTGAWLVALALLALGVGLRLYDLTDQPKDFHPTRQLRSAIVARGLYYSMLSNADPRMYSSELREQAISMGYSTGQYEPSILEYVVARIYLLTGEENLWVARIINTLLWALGGLALFDLARRAVSPGAALFSLAYFMALPFAVQASRSFQPDPGMVAWIVLAVYFLYRWSENPTWKWALPAGLMGGIAVLTKFPAIYIVGGASIAIVLSRLGLRRFWRNPHRWSVPEVWVMSVLMIAPALIFYVNRQGRASEYLDSWTISLSHLLLEPGTYGRWLNLTQDLMGLAGILLGLVGVLIARPAYRALLIGMWVGYLAYGLFFPYQMYTHSYYHLQLVPIIALSLAPLAELLIGKLRQEKRTWQVLFVGVILVGLFFTSWLSIIQFASEDYRSEPEFWQQVAGYLPVDGKIVALTQDYGYPLMYYGWRKVTLWPNRGERSLASLRGKGKEFDDYFANKTEGKSYFLITAFNQFNDQPDLQEYLAEHFPTAAEGQGYLLYDLLHPLTQPGSPPGITIPP